MKALYQNKKRAVALPARFTLALLSVVMFSLGGCGDTEDDFVPPEPKMKKKSSAAKKAVEKDSAAANSQVFTYNAIGKRDPFRNYFSELDREEQTSRKLTELQQFDLDQLRLVAVIVGTATPKAMVEDPNKKGHVVKVGTLIGKHWGQVKHIRRGEIIVQEEFRDFTGRRVTHLVPMKLPEEADAKLRLQ